MDMEALMAKLKKMRKEGLIRSHQKEVEKKRQNTLRAFYMKLRRDEEKKLAAKMLGGRYCTIVLERCDGSKSSPRSSKQLENSCDSPATMNLKSNTCNLDAKIILEKCESPEKKITRNEKVNTKTNSPVGSQSVKILLERLDEPKKTEANVLSDNDGTQLMNTSEVQEDLSSKNYLELSEGFVWIDDAFLCTYSDGKFKIVSEKGKKLQDEPFPANPQSKVRSKKLGKRQPLKPLEKKNLLNRKHRS